MASFRDIWNLIVTGDTSDVERKLKGVGTTTDQTGATVDSTFRGRMSASLGHFAEKIPGVSGLMDKFGVSSSQAGALMGTAVAGGAVAAGAAVTKFVTDSVAEFQQQAQEVLHFRDVSGLAADEASRFVAVADDFGVAGADLATAIGKMDLAAGSTQKLQNLGIEIGKTKDGGYDAQQTFLNVVDVFNSTDDASRKAAIGSQIFGKGWQGMSKLLEQGSTSLRTSLDSVKDFQIFSDEDIRKSEEYRLALDDFNDAVKGIERDVGEKLVPVLSKAVTEFANMIEEAEKLGGPIGKGFHMLGVDAGDFFKVLTNPGGAALDRVRDLGGAVGDLFGVGDGKTTAKGFENINEQAGKTTESILQSAAAAANHKYEMDKAAESAKIYMENNEGLRKSLDDQRDALEKATKATDDYRQAQHDLVNEQLGLEGATNSAKDAIDDYNTKVLDHTTTVKDLRDANLDVRESWVSLGDQAVATATQQATLHGATLDVKGALDAQVTSLQTLYANLASDSPLRRALDEYILALYNIPGQVHTDVDFSGTDPITGRAIGGTRREGTGAGGSAASGSAIVSDIKAFESSNGSGWRS